MIIEPYFLHRIGVPKVESYCEVRSRVVKKGFERVQLSITQRSFDAIVREACRPISLKESICAIYPDHPRPVPRDIVEMDVQKDMVRKSKVLLTVLIKRGHYYTKEEVDPSSISNYLIQEVEDETLAARTGV